ncbi:MAG: TerB family tellurite resistance protein [Rhodobiaceae bacterium]|nr:TerB family tellurite resistance protein [Rhodobiaceae bacterium]
MTIWQRIGEIAGRISKAAPIGTIIDRIAELLPSFASPEARRRVAFSVAMIALSAKMAKADGVVAQSEINAFRQLFEVPQGEEANVARLFAMAQQDVAGFDVYARRIARLYPDEHEIFGDIVDGLFEIAKADGVVHEYELGFLHQVAGIFGIGEAEFEIILARHVGLGAGDPYRVLGVARDVSDGELRRHYRRLAAENHPDKLIARGVPEEFLRIANDRLAAINAAYDQIARERGL